MSWFRHPPVLAGLTLGVLGAIAGLGSCTNDGATAPEVCATLPLYNVRDGGPTTPEDQQRLQEAIQAECVTGPGTAESKQRSPGTGTGGTPGAGGAAGAAGAP